ncbi:MAG: helix-turn-helix transcriptional regulator [Spirochaetes bacterium]|nr:helix-turn-helix transcriptional regulator [Spirochaetota bacterium]
MFEKLYYETAIILYQERIERGFKVKESIDKLKYFSGKLALINNINLSNLSIKENEILGDLLTSLSYKEIAIKHFITENTVKKHVTNIFDKTYCRNRVELIVKMKGK